MSPSRAAAYVGAGVLLIAWFASAVSVSRQPRAARTAAAAESADLDALASDVQAQAVRLRQRMAAAPAPQTPSRNPFMFASREVEPAWPAARPAEAPAEVTDAPAAEPILQLIGVAEQNGAEGLVRTAMIVDGAEQLLMLRAGDEIAGRYRLVAVTADAVELEDLATGATRRLVLR